MKEKRKLSIVLVLIMIFTLSVPAFADGSVQPEKETAATREYAVAAFIDAAEAQTGGNSGALSAFTDADEVSASFLPELEYAAGNGIIKGLLLIVVTGFNKRIALIGGPCSQIRHGDQPFIFAGSVERKRLFRRLGLDTIHNPFVNPCHLAVCHCSIDKDIGY